VSAEAQSPAKIGLWKGRTASPSWAVTALETASVIEFPAISLHNALRKRPGKTVKTSKDNHKGFGIDLGELSSTPLRSLTR
jgi:hypothetical protein